MARAERFFWAPTVFHKHFKATNCREIAVIRGFGEDSKAKDKSSNFKYVPVHFGKLTEPTFWGVQYKVTSLSWMKIRMILPFKLLLKVVLRKCPKTSMGLKFGP